MTPQQPTPQQPTHLLPTEFFSKEGFAPCRADDRRRFARMYYRAAAVVRFCGELPAFPRGAGDITAYLSDLSRSGMSFLCDRELYPCEKLEFSLDRIGTKRLVVKRCRRLPSGVFEVGCEFGV
jgi:hypothetical protein